MKRGLIERRPARRVTARGAVVTGLVATTVALPLAATTPAAAAVNLCGHPADTVPPQISQLTFSTQTVDTTTGTQAVTLTADASDTATSGAGSGVKTLFAYLTGPHRSYVQVRFHLASGTATDGQWSGTASFSKKNWPGTYRLSQLWTIDAAGNYQEYAQYGSTAYSPTAISLQTGWNTQIVVSGPTPPKPKPPVYSTAGVLSTFKISPSAVNTTASAKQVTVTARFKGHQPSHAWVYLSHGRSKTHPFINLHARLHRVTHGWRAHLTVPRWLGTVVPTFNLQAEFHRHVRPGYVEYDPTWLKEHGFPSTLAITSGLDLVPPQITGLTLTPDSVDTTTGAQTVAVTASVTDALSGVKSVEIDLNRNTGPVFTFGSGSNEAGALSAVGPGKFGYFDTGGDVRVRMTKTGSEWTGTATFRRCVPSGKWRINAVLSDNAQNGIYLGSGKLAKLGLPSTMQVKAAPQYVFDPVVTGATAAGAYHQITLDFDEGVQNITTNNLSVYDMSPADQRYQQTLPITSIACSDGTAIVDCSGSAGLVTSAVLTIPAVTGGRHYEVWADLGATTSQITDAGGLPVSWQYAIAQVRGD
jgi:hypothetical protein